MIFNKYKAADAAKNIKYNFSNRYHYWRQYTNQQNCEKMQQQQMTHQDTLDVHVSAHVSLAYPIDMGHLEKLLIDVALKHTVNLSK